MDLMYLTTDRGVDQAMLRIFSGRRLDFERATAGRRGISMNPRETPCRETNSRESSGVAALPARFRGAGRWIEWGEL